MRMLKLSLVLLLMLPLLVMLVSGCAASSPPTLPPGVRAAAIDPLPASARQPALSPTLCSPSCSAVQTRERETSLQLLTPPTQPASNASVPTTP